MIPGATAIQASRQAAAGWRSLLFVPAHLQWFVSRAHEREANRLILNLEDAVPTDMKPSTRLRLPDCVRQAGQNGAAILVRVNHGLRALAPDLEAAVICGVSALVLPKAESAAWLAEIADAVLELERERELPAFGIGLVLQIETPAALPHLHSLASAHPRVCAMKIGPEDFCAYLGALPGPGSLLGPNLAVLCAARAARITPLGFVGSISIYEDTEAFGRMVGHARQLGFRGAMAVHPKQVEILNRCFVPTAAESGWAQRVVDGDCDARSQHARAFRLDGRMIDAPVVRRAEETLRRRGA